MSKRDPTLDRHKLAEDCRNLAVRVRWFDAKGDEAEALRLADALIAKAIQYEALLRAELAARPDDSALDWDDPSRPDDS
jgi:hypothetical protein